MKNLYTLFAILAIASTLHAQKVDLDGEVIPLDYLRFPDRPFPASYKFYSAIVSAKPNDLPAMGMTEKTVLQYLVVPGYKRVPEGGNFNVELSVEDFKYVGPYEVKTETSTTKDKAGKETKTTSYYCYCKYSQPVNLRVRNEEGKTIEEKAWLAADRDYKSGTYSTFKEAKRFGDEQMGREIAKKRYQETLSAFAEVRQLLSARYGYAPTKGQTKLEILDSEKHPDYAAFQSAYQTSKTAFGAMHATASLDSVKLLAQPALDFFDTQKDKYDAAEKTGKKLKYACLNNLSVLYYWMEDFEQAAKYANAVIVNDYEPKSGKRMLEDIEDLKAAMQKCGHNTRHFRMEIDSSEMEAAGETVYDSDKSLRVEAYKDQKKAVSATTVEQEGVINYADGQVVRGTFVLDGPQRFFDDKTNTRFAVESGQNIHVSVPNYKLISSFTIGDRTFRCLPYKSANSAYVGSKAGVEILEVIYESPKIAAYLAYTDERRGLANPPEYVIYKVAENDYTSLNGMKFALNLNKGIRKEYGECKGVAEVLDQDGFKRTPEQIAKLAQLIEGCME